MASTDQPIMANEEGNVAESESQTAIESTEEAGILKNRVPPQHHPVYLKITNQMGSPVRFVVLSSPAEVNGDTSNVHMNYWFGVTVEPRQTKTIDLDLRTFRFYTGYLPDPIEETKNFEVTDRRPMRLSWSGIAPGSVSTVSQEKLEAGGMRMSFEAGPPETIWQENGFCRLKMTDSVPSNTFVGIGRPIPYDLREDRGDNVLVNTWRSAPEGHVVPNVYDIAPSRGIVVGIPSSQYNDSRTLKRTDFLKAASADYEFWNMSKLWLELTPSGSFKWNWD